MNAKVYSYQNKVDVKGEVRYVESYPNGDTLIDFYDEQGNCFTITLSGVDLDRKNFREIMQEDVSAD